jgi:predicted nucleic acid-binding protein
MALVLDTGPVLAALDLDDPAHEPCATLLEHSREPLVIVAPTLVEIDYWIRKRLSLGVWLTFVEDVEAGVYRLEQLSPADVLRAARLESQYADLGLGFVDAAVVAVCERLQEIKVATLDRRHFAALRPAHCKAFDLLP